LGIILHNSTLFAHPNRADVDIYTRILKPSGRPRGIPSRNCEYRIVLGLCVLNFLRLASPTMPGCSRCRAIFHRIFLSQTRASQVKVAIHSRVRHIQRHAAMTSENILRENMVSVLDDKADNHDWAELDTLDIARRKFPGSLCIAGCVVRRFGV